MSRDLSFWKAKEKAEVCIENKKIYKALSEGQFLAYINEIPIGIILGELKKTFKEWKNYNNVFFEKDDEFFELMLTRQFVRVDCYGMTVCNINKIIDIMDSFNCPLYDSAIDVRFDGMDLPCDSDEKNLQDI